MSERSQDGHQELGVATSTSTRTRLRHTIQPHETTADLFDRADSTSNLIRQELDSNAALPVSRMRALERALGVVKAFGTVIHHEDLERHDSTIEGDCSSLGNIPRELYYLMVNGRFPPDFLSPIGQV